MSVVVTVIIIITHEACFPLLFLIGGENNAILNFYSEETFSCLFWKGKSNNRNRQGKKKKAMETKHVIGEILHNFSFEGARVPGTCPVDRRPA